MKRNMLLVFALGFCFGGVAIGLSASHGARAASPTPPIGPIGTRLCRGVNPNQWNDTINVPDSWSAGSCQNFATSIGALHYILGCATDNPANPVIWGPMDNAAGPAKCGWPQ
jgi:hypothetical protein